MDVPQIEADADSQVISHYQPFSDFEVVLPSKKEIEQLRKVKQYGIIIEHEALDNVIVIPSYWEAGAHYYDFGTVRKAVKTTIIVLNVSSYIRMLSRQLGAQVTNLLAKSLMQNIKMMLSCLITRQTASFIFWMER